MIILLGCILLFHDLTSAQTNDLEKRYAAFRNEAQKNYNDFRDKANREYAEFVRRAWIQYKALPAIPRPKEEKPIPPTVYPEDEEGKPIKNNPVPIDEVVPVIKPIQQPKPVNPIKEESQPIGNYFSFRFFGTETKVRLNDNLRFRLTSCSGEELARGWEICSGKEYNNVIRDCLEIRVRHKLCDWAYLLMLKEMTDSFFLRNKLQ